MSMSDSSGTTSASTGQGKTEVAKEQASQVSQKATEAAGQVAQTSKQQAGEVAQEAKTQALDLAGQVRSQVTTQASAQRDKLVQVIRSFGDELQQMANGSGSGSGMAADLANQASARINSVVSFVESREPADLLEDLRRIARQRPGAFLLGATTLGALAGRLTKGAAAARSAGSSGGSYSGSYSGSSGNLPVPSTTATSTSGFAGAGYADGGYSDSTIDLPGAAPAYGSGFGEPVYESTHGIGAEGTRDPSTGPLAPGGTGYGDTGRSSGGQGWSA